MQVRRTVAPFSWLTWRFLFHGARPAGSLTIAWCEIAFPRPHNKVLSCRGIQKHSYVTISSITFRIVGSVGQQILIPDVRGNAAADRSNLLELFREKTLPARCL